MDKVIGIAGVTQDKLWMQIISDVTGREFIINKNTNYGTISGCAILGAVGSGSFNSLDDAVEAMVHEKEVVKPNLDNTKEYEKYFEKYIDLYESLKDLR